MEQLRFIARHLYIILFNHIRQAVDADCEYPLK